LVFWQHEVCEAEHTLAQAAERHVGVVELLAPLLVDLVAEAMIRQTNG
jgi:hypothetical protein